MNYFLIILGGGIGALCRYLISRNISNFFNQIFPLGTLIVNLSGCFIIGLLAGLFENIIISPNLRVFIFIGFLGGYTTFSTFGLETFKLIQSNESFLAILNILFSNIGAIFLVFTGYFISKIIIHIFK